ncbi:MAG: hypothetical protein ALAOOOJD_01089 [bacterium]|nr:hypothetical protein [bacterium]
MVFRQAGNGAVVYHFALFIAPRRVHDLADAAFFRVTCDNAINERHGVRAADFVFEQWGDVDQRRGIANGVIFAFVRHFINTNGQITGPIAPIVTLAQRRHAGIKRSRKRHGGKF